MIKLMFSTSYFIGFPILSQAKTITPVAPNICMSLILCFPHLVFTQKYLINNVLPVPEYHKCHKT